MPLFSIILPAYNSGNLLDETIQSLLNQSYPDYEIIIVDDGSSDNTFDNIQHYKDRIKIFWQENKGSASARNLGISKANGNYIVSFDHDDILFPYAIEIYSKVLEYFDYPPILVAKIKYFSRMNELQFNAWNYDNILCTKFECFFKKNMPFSTFNSALIIKKEVLLKISGYPANSFGMDDSRMLFRIGNEKPMVVINYPETVGYRKHDNNWSKNIDYITRGIIEFIKDERRKKYPGGKKLKFDRRGLIGSNVLSMFKYYFGIKNLKSIISIESHLRSLLFTGIIRKLVSCFYVSEKHIVKFHN